MHKLRVRGLIDRDRGGGRRLAHHLTDDGRRLLERCDEETRIALEQGLAGLDEHDRAALRDLLRRVVDILIANPRAPLSGRPLFQGRLPG